MPDDLNPDRTHLVSAPIKMKGLYIVMGVTGSGKSSVAAALAEKTSGAWLDADVFHPDANKAKMASGVPLTDEDRSGWLDVLHEKLLEHQAHPTPFFLACSALKKIYRDRLAAGLPEIVFIYLRGTPELLRERINSRVDHFMPASLLESQLATLEEPEEAILLDIQKSVSALVDEALLQMEITCNARSRS